MVVFPNCKINLGLRILNKREDGFHNLQTLFYPIALTDALELIRNPEPQRSGDVQFSQSGLEVAGAPNQNLCVQAYYLLKKDFPKLAPVSIHLHKVIPLGAGLGGGSSDGAFTLQAINKQFDLGLSKEQLLAYAFQLGSDCPFFIHNQPCYATSRGELLEPVSLDLSNYTIALVNPGIHVPTGWAFTQLNRTNQQLHYETDLRSLIAQPVANWKDHIWNDFEAPVVQQYPEIGAIKTQLYKAGALYASMSGSGSTVFGIFPKQHSVSLHFPDTYFSKLV